MTASIEHCLRARELRARIYAQHAAGCCLHVACDDGNVDDDFCKSAIKRAVREGHGDCQDLGNLMLLMSKTQRKKLNAGGYELLAAAHARKEST